MKALSDPNDALPGGQVVHRQCLQCGHAWVDYDERRPACVPWGSQQLSPPIFLSLSFAPMPPATGQTDAKPTPNLAALDEKYAYEEISKAEYEKLKVQAAAPAAKTCPACGQPVEPAHQFCPHFAAPYVRCANCSRQINVIS